MEEEKTNLEPSNQEYEAGQQDMPEMDIMQTEPVLDPKFDFTNSQTGLEDTQEPVGWFSGFKGAIIMVLILGAILGLLMWWVWGRSPLVTWVRIAITIAPIIILFIII